MWLTRRFTSALTAKGAAPAAIQTAAQAAVFPFVFLVIAMFVAAATAVPSQAQRARGETRGADASPHQSQERADHARLPHIRIDVRWPWVTRHRHGWSPRYRYRQVVYVDTGSRRRDARIELHTVYRHRVRRADVRRAELDVIVERIEVFEGGRFVGAVDRIPGNLSSVRATLYRDGETRFDRQLYILGSSHDGFEVISTRYYGGRVWDRYDRRDGYRAGRLDFRRERVVPVRRSRLFDPSGYGGYVPIELLPEDEVWLADYGHRAPSRGWFGDGIGYFGIHLGVNDAVVFGGDRSRYQRVDRREEGRGERVADRMGYSSSQESLRDARPLQRSEDVRFEGEDGVEVHMRRESTLERVE
ncbi:MAG: hypothetical protein WD021_09435 [Rhodothermales bacterium]